jgi:cell division protein FtsZ
MTIQTEAGFNANIMGVGEDETLGDAIAVTIATGFDIEQQNGIVNTEPKKNNSHIRG